MTKEKVATVIAYYSGNDPAPSPAPAVGELVGEIYAAKNLLLSKPVDSQLALIAFTLSSAAARISQLEAALEAALPYVEAANRAEHLMDGFGPRSHQSSDDHVAAIRALLKGQS
jgi:hypothetical protein